MSTAPTQSSFKLFENPASMMQLKVEVLYERIYLHIGSSLDINDNLDISQVSEFLGSRFDPYLNHKAYKDDTASEKAYWVSRDAAIPVVVEVTSENMSTYAADLVADSMHRRSSELCVIRMVSRDLNALEELYTELIKYRHVSTSRIYLLVNSYGEVDLRPLEIAESAPALKLNYGEDFTAVSDKIITNLTTKASGLYLFYGAPGTGKSSYIRYLLSGVLNRKVIYIPVGLIDSLMRPDFLPLLLSNKNSVLVIEDAEKALLSREESQENSSIVSAILNLTDSFISAALNISIVATFNTSKENIDKALLRKGRLKYSYEFKKLSVDDAQKLVDCLDFDYIVREPMTLGDVYNLKDEVGYQPEEKKTIKGFGS
jgi:hypothetical protein